MMNKYKCVFWLILITTVSISCTGNIYQVAYPTLNDGDYDSEFPYKSCSHELRAVMNSIKRLNSSAYYDSYFFSPEEKITHSMLTKKIIHDSTIQKSYFNRTTSGTATIIYYDGSRVALLTCAHIIDFPDTIITYYHSEDTFNTFVQSVSIKSSQSNFIIDIPEKGDFKILAIDVGLDMAILGKEFENPPPIAPPVLAYPMGKAKKLDWGSFVYLLGYPMGYQMVTKGIVSSPDRDRFGSFLVDALFNKGFSGGIVLAIKDGVPNFELVGIAKSVSGNYEYVLTPPEKLDAKEIDSNLPYQGEIYAQLKQDINYGITHVVAIEAIQDFLKKNEWVFRQNHYKFDRFFNTAATDSLTSN